MTLRNEGEEFTRARLVKWIGEKYEVGEEAVSGWLVGVDVLTAFMTSEREGDAIDEGRAALETSRNAVRLLLQSRMQKHVDHADADLRGNVSNGLARDQRPRPSTDAKPPMTAYMEVDGVIVMTRELTEAASAPLDGARVCSVWTGLEAGRGDATNSREVKNAVMYTDADCAQTMDSRGSVLEKTYVSRVGHWMLFAVVLWLAVLKLRFDQADRLGLLSDGADSIRSLAAWMPCPVFLILDLFLAKHRIWELSSALWDDDDQRKRWANRECDASRRTCTRCWARLNGY